jgi:hypothetical protein
LGTAGSVALVAFGTFAAWSWLMAAARKAARFVDEPGSEAALGSMQDVRSQLGDLIRQATRDRRRLVIFIDDLERCEPRRAVEVCRVASQLLGHQDVVTVLLADMSIVSGAAPGGSLYLQKLIQLQFQLPPSDPDGLATMVKRIAGPEEASGGWVFNMVDRVMRTTPEQLGLLGLAIAIAVLVAGTAVAAFFLGAQYLVVAMGLGLLSAIGSRQIEGLRRRRLTVKIDNALRAELLEQGPTIDELVDQLTPRFGQRHEELIRQRAQRLFTDESALLQQAESTLLAYLPVPRSVKRAMNHLRVLLVIAEGRYMLGGLPELERGHLWKWVVLGELWPELGYLLVHEPEKTELLEGAATPDQLKSVLRELDLAANAPEVLFKFLRMSPQLGTVARRVVSFEPAASTEIGERFSS